MSIFNYYPLFKSHKGTSHQELKAMYRVLSRRHHPDKGGEVAQFQEVTRAWSTLGDPKARHTLHIQMAGLGEDCDNCATRGYTMRSINIVTRARHICEKCQGNGFIERKR